MAAEPEDLSLFELAQPMSAEDALVAFRYCDYDVPFWVRPNTRPGRWHAAGSDPTQYWALSPEGAWAELIRYEELATEEELDQVRMPIWVCRVSMMGLADLSDEVTRARFSLTAEDLVDDDWSACQQASVAIRQEARGVLVPSAALAGALNLTLFGPRRIIAWERRPALASAVSAAVVAIGRPPRTILPRVQRRTVYPTLF